MPVRPRNRLLAPRCGDNLTSLKRPSRSEVQGRKARGDMAKVRAARRFPVSNLKLNRINGLAYMGKNP